jgi:hypothetical protein
MNENTKLCSFDITNIPLRETKSIIHNILNNDQQITSNIKQELITLLNTTLDQNYIKFGNEYYKQNDGVAMRAPTSEILAEIFIQHLEHTKIAVTLRKHHIIDYYTYVNHILIVYNTRITNIRTY